MRLNEFKVPNIKILPDLSKSDLDAYLKKHCSEFLEQSGGRMMYRGMKERPEIFVSHSPVGRVPVDLSPIEQKMIDKALKEHGFKALRSNSIFCTGTTVGLEVDYGPIYLICPFDGFKFTWSEVVHDALWTKDKKGWLDGDIVSKYKFRQDDLKAALSSGHEIYIHGKYLAVSMRQLETYENI